MKKKLTCLLLCGLCFAPVYSQRFIRDFVLKQQNDTTRDKIILIAPKTILHSHANIASMNGFSDMDSVQQDNIIRKYTKVLNKVDDAKVKAQFLQDLTYGLEKLGLWVETRDEKSKTIAPQEHIFDLSSVEIQEFQNFYEDTLREEGYVYPIKIPFSSVDFSVWTVFPEEGREWVFFQTRNKTEYIDFQEAAIENNGSLTLHYELYPVSANDVYVLAHRVAEETARYIYHFLLNRYIWDATAGKETHYYTVNPQSLIIEQHEEPAECFDVVEKVGSKIPVTFREEME